MNTFFNMWAQMTEAQGTVIAGVLTILAAVFGVLLGSWLFQGKVKTMKEALEKTESEFKDFQESMEVQVGALMETLNKVRLRVSDLNDLDNVFELENSDVSVDREGLKKNWYSIRDIIEQLASNDTIDGRTRAKYSRLSRYSYEPLISAMKHDSEHGVIPVHANWGALMRANEIWQFYQRQPTQPSRQEFEEMISIKESLDY